MGTDAAGAAAVERKADSRPRPPEEKPDGAAATSTAPGSGLGARVIGGVGAAGAATGTGGPGPSLGAAPGGLGARVLQAKAVVGGAEVPTERAADAAADRVMRQVDPEPTAASDDVGAAPEVPDRMQEYLNDSRGQGMPLPPAVRAAFEESFRRPFENVRIHDDARADDAVRSIHAVAFTIGSDIYFRSGAYDPNSADGKRLLAHELAHVVQQSPVIQRKPAPGLGGDVIRRAGGGGTSQPMRITGAPDKFTGGTIDASSASSPKIVLDSVYLPKFKCEYHPPRDLVWTPPKYKGGFARRRWVESVVPKIAAHVPGHAAKTGQSTQPPWFFMLPKSWHSKPDFLAFGSANDVATALAVPRWVPDGTRLNNFEVDHKREEQLGGSSDDEKNLQLLDRSKNAASGPAIKASIAGDIKGFLAAANERLNTSIDQAVLRNDGNLKFKEALSKPNPRTKKASPVWTDELPADLRWSIDDVGSEKVFAPLVAMDDDIKKSLTGKPGALSLFPRPGGGLIKHRSVNYEPNGKFINPENINLRGAFRIVSGNYRPERPVPQLGEQVGQVEIEFFSVKDKSPDRKEVLSKAFMNFYILHSGLPYSGFLNTEKIREISDIRHAFFSPVQLAEAEFDFDQGLVARGRIPKPTLPLLENVELAVIIDGASVGVEAVISAGELKLPGPFKVTGGSLAIAAATGGIGVDGTVDFAVGKIATGYLKGRKAKSDDFEIEAGLDFDKKIFDEAHVGGSYSKNGWSIDGRIGVGKDKVKGIKKATADVAFRDGKLDAEGTFETDLKGVEQGTLGFAYDEANGMSITGQILLGKGIPGIKGGKINATVAEIPAGGWSLSGGLSAEPDVPGLTGTIGGTYDDGAFAAEADLAYERGIAKGALKLGLTNRTLDQAGQPTGPVGKDGKLNAYGGGVVTLAITPWLQGTVGLKLTPKGEVEVSGKVELPKAFTVFDEKLIERKILSVGIDLPIVGVAVAGQRIGIFATIKGGVTVNAGFGPGQLRDVALEVTYNPSRPDDTTVKGGGTFAVPAHAGMRIQVDGGLGVGIPVVSATAGVSIFGEVGLAGEPSAAAALQWTPRTGIVLDAKGELFVEPKFRFGIDAFVDVTADLWITEVELYRRKWQLAAFEYGSSLRFGMVFPLHYESGKPFALSFDQIQWTYPQIDPADLLGGLMKQIVG
ncbi:eCIS core domain-containing protein [Amycolatopsis kentuckyensis]|uniref:eCIS core domain-containing protein n=1 Tax=Amycolatopsis kentuckyensis TaxID=218823 RepID=UPI000A3A33DC|nr:DUF4157 domain-containing protein [Amycolatopsis kentuckyensis]